MLQQAANKVQVAVVLGNRSGFCDRKTPVTFEVDFEPAANDRQYEKLTANRRREGTKSALGPLENSW
jgi:hypothetical protein